MMCWVWGQVESPWGKSLDHMQLSAPHQLRTRPPTASLKKVEYTWRCQYSLGSIRMGSSAR